MKLGKATVSASMIVAAMLSGPAIAVQYTVTDLGSLSGPSYASDINSAGQVTVSCSSSPSKMCSFLYSNGVMQRMPLVPNTFASQAYGLNNRGNVVGSCAGMWYRPQAFIYDGGSAQGLPFDSAQAINDNGQIVGYKSDSVSGTRAVLYSGGVTQILGTLGGSDSWAYDINSSGQVIGDSTTASGATHAFIYAGGAMQDIQTFGDYNSYAREINDKGQVVGGIRSSDDSFHHAFLYSDGIMHDLGTFGGTWSGAGGINASGQIVGAYGMSMSDSRGFLYTDASMYDLNDMLVPGSDWLVLNAMAINDSGLIAGRGRNAAGVEHALLLTPVPEPASLALLSLGLLAALRRRNWGVAI